MFSRRFQCRFENKICLFIKMERRQFLRVRKNIRIACRRFSEEEIKRTIDLTEDISPEGLLFESEIDAVEDSIVEITLFTKDKKIKALGKVLRKSKKNSYWQIAVKFIRIDQDSRNYLAELVEQGMLTREK